VIDVERIESDAAEEDVGALLAELERQPGIWMGCDVASEGLFRRESMACAVPALRFSLTGSVLEAVALTPCGGGILAEFARRGGITGAMPTGAAAIRELRRFLGMFAPPSAELGFYGTFSFDYFLLGSDAALPDDNRQRLVLYFPERVLRAQENRVRRIDFRFSTTPMPVAGQVRTAHGAAQDDAVPGRHAARVAQGIDRLKRGELYSLVLSQTFRRPATTAPGIAFAALRKRNPYPGMFFCNLGGGEILFGASPDLQVRADSNWVEAAPVCGTYRRGADPIEEAEQAFALLASDKEGAAIALCADSTASEHATVCEPGSVEVLSYRRPHFFSTIIHAIDHLRGRRREGPDGFDILFAHAAPATVTGLPKAEAIRAIAELEADWRGWYAGAVARLGSDGSVEAYTVLRAARVVNGIAEIRTGGNVLVDSDPRHEEEESNLKAQTLFRVLEGHAPEPARAAASSVRWRIRFIDSLDPFASGLRNAIERAGGALSEDGTAVLSGRSDANAWPTGPLLAIGDAALELLEREGARTELLPTPEFARAVEARATKEGCLHALGVFQAGWYATSAIPVGGLPAHWIETAVSARGWVLAAQHREQPMCALLFRPDSVLSRRGNSGTHALCGALEWLEHGMFARSSGRPGS